MNLLLWLLINLCYLITSECKISYEGYSLLRITPSTHSQLNFLLKINTEFNKKLDFWLHTSAVNNSADVMVTPSDINRLKGILNEVQMPYTVLIDDIAKIINDDLIGLSNTDSKLGRYDKYNSLEEINQYLRNLVTQYPNHTSLIELGRSFEGRTLLLLQVSSNPGGEKPAIWIQGGAHAREQISPAAVLFIAEKLASLYVGDNEIFELVNRFDYYILTVLNPDGYEHCQVTDRLWRKTRSRHTNSDSCLGVDANRNWDIKWNDASGSSSDPCSHNFAGPAVFSEPEIKAVSQFMLLNLKGRLKLFLDFHSYSQRWLTPWGHTSNLPPNYQQQKELAEVAVSAIERINGTKYSVGSTGNILYTVTGGMRDWAYDIIDANYSYVVELRDTGKYGFLLPRRLILPTVTEAWEAVRAMGRKLISTTDL